MKRFTEKPSEMTPADMTEIGNLINRTNFTVVSVNIGKRLRHVMIGATGLFGEILKQNLISGGVFYQFRKKQ